MPGDCDGVQPGSAAKQEFKYTLLGTTPLTAGLDVATGQVVAPTLEATRTEPEFRANRELRSQGRKDLRRR